MRRIYKWQLGVTSSLPWSPDDRLLLVAHQEGDLPTLWAEQEDSGGNAGARLFVIIGTGQPAPGGMEHVGSAICGEFVWHVYAEPVERPS